MDSSGDDAIVRTGCETIIDELGHYFVLSEEEIWEIETKIWRDEGYKK